MPASSALRKQPRTQEKSQERRTDRPIERPVERPAARPKAQPKPRLYHARMVVTRVEEWCVEATSAAEAEALFAAGGGHRCTPGESIAVELERLIDE